MKYDDASWHYGGDFPADLPDEAGATHTGMFLAWALLRGLGGEHFSEEDTAAIIELQARSITPGKFFLKYCDGKFVDEDLSEVGNKFAESYFDFETGLYLADYEQVLAKDLDTLYHVPDSWESFDELSAVLDSRLSEWR